ncbi:MAG: hypothetical protein Q8M19_03530 [Reyranella sp.]|nr:hypothetical protein [Reyranella sp.]
MTLEEFRAEMDASWQSAKEEAGSFKDPYIVLERLRALYARFDSGERAMADQVIAEWALEGDEDRRSYALTLIEDLRIGRAVPSLRALAERLTHSAELGASFWVKRATKIVDDLAKQGWS